jgi:hypothetical protein
LFILSLGFAAHGHDSFIHCPQGHFKFTSEVILEG